MHTYFHTSFGFCLWDLLALAVLVVMVVVLVVHIIRQKKRQQSYEDALSEKIAENAVRSESAPK